MLRNLSFDLMDFLIDIDFIVILTISTVLIVSHILIMNTKMRDPFCLRSFYHRSWWFDQELGFPLGGKSLLGC